VPPLALPHSVILIIINALPVPRSWDVPPRGRMAAYRLLAGLTLDVSPVSCIRWRNLKCVSTGSSMLLNS